MFGWVEIETIIVDTGWSISVTAPKATGGYVAIIFFITHDEVRDNGGALQTIFCASLEALYYEDDTAGEKTKRATIQ